jgi:hypothetical protein
MMCHEIAFHKPRVKALRHQCEHVSLLGEVNEQLTKAPGKRHHNQTTM